MYFGNPGVMFENTRMSMIAAVANDNVIGYRGSMPWNLPEDLQRFKELTLHHPIVMGQKTYYSIGRVLPKRHNIIVTLDQDWEGPDEATVGYSIEDALRIGAEESEEVFVIGGGEMYRQAIEYADRLYITRIYADFSGDTYFPDYSDFCYIVDSEPHKTSDFSYEFLTLER